MPKEQSIDPRERRRVGLTDRPDVSEHVPIVGLVELNILSRWPFDPNVVLLSFVEDIVVGFFGIDRRIENGDEFHSLSMKIVDVFGKAAESNRIPSEVQLIAEIIDVAVHDVQGDLGVERSLHRGFHVRQSVVTVSTQLKAQCPVRRHVGRSNHCLILSNDVFRSRTGEEEEIEDPSDRSIGEHRLIVFEFVEFVILSIGIEDQHAKGLSIVLDRHVERLCPVQILVSALRRLIAREDTVTRRTFQHMSETRMSIFPETFERDETSSKEQIVLRDLP